MLHIKFGFDWPNCRSTSRPPPPSRVPFSPALSVEFTTDKINEVNGTKARLSDYDWPSGFRAEDVSLLWKYTCI